jgi:predicted RNA polymerase sigma factor
VLPPFPPGGVADRVDAAGRRRSQCGRDRPRSSDVGTDRTRRITRAKQSIKDSGIPFALPRGEEWAGRLGAIARVLYLIFNEGYASTMGSDLLRTDLAAEAIRLARALHEALPDGSEVSGLLALML